MDWIFFPASEGNRKKSNLSGGPIISEQKIFNPPPKVDRVLLLSSGKQ